MWCSHVSCDFPACHVTLSLSDAYGTCYKIIILMHEHGFDINNNITIHSFLIISQDY